jgi:hypothetical protein
MRCDREKLMLPMLGLYAEIYRSRATNPTSTSIFDAIEPHIDTIFPKSISYDCQVQGAKPGSFIGKLIHGSSSDNGLAQGHKTITGEKKVALFGGLIEEIRARVREQEQEEGAQQGRFRSGFIEVLNRASNRKKSTVTPVYILSSPVTKSN